MVPLPKACAVACTSIWVDSRMIVRSSGDVTLTFGGKTSLATRGAIDRGLRRVGLVLAAGSPPPASESTPKRCRDDSEAVNRLAAVAGQANQARLTR